MATLREQIMTGAQMTPNTGVDRPAPGGTTPSGALMGTQQTNMGRQGAPPAPRAPAGPQPTGSAPAPEGGMQPANPAEEQQFATLVDNVKDWIWGDGFETTIAELKSEPDPSLGAGKVIVESIIAQQNFARIAKNPISDGILFEAGLEISSELFTLMEQTGIYKAPDEDTEQQKMLEAVMYAEDMYIADRGSKGMLDVEGAVQLGDQLRGVNRGGGQMTPNQAPIGNQMVPGGPPNV